MTRRNRRSAAIATDLMFAPLVAMMRLPMMAAEAQKSGKLPLETLRAGNEKLEAMAEGALAAQMTYAKAMMSFWPDVMMGRKPSLISGATTEKAIQDSLRPASRRVRSNFKRLSGKA